MTKMSSEFPFPVEEWPDIWIPMRDGTRLAARVWLPAGAAAGPVPAILEMIPYRKRDGMARRDEMMHPWFAGHGYAAVRVDLRGSGDSGGLLEDEYCPQEQEDGLDVIAWLAAQPWCSGRVGMIGISWGGFNGLQIAARRPPALGAVITVGSTDDRYADDVHHMGGAQLSSNFTWANTFQADLTRPPDPAVAGEGWRAQWLDRLENQTFLIGRWLDHPMRDAYWRHGSVCEDFGRIACPILAVGGWADSYTNAVDRLLRGLSAPCRAIIGPWGHDYPHTAVPGPQIGFLQECLRWWDFWLKDRPGTVMEEPALRVYLQHGMPADPCHGTRPGEWLAIGGPLESASSPRLLHLTAAMTLAGDPGGTVASIPCRSVQTLGFASGEWCPYGRGGDMPGEQSAEDGASVCFDGPVLDHPLDIVGAPRLHLRLVPDGVAGNLVVRLCDVDPEGRSARVSWGVLDLTAAGGDFSGRTPLVPGSALSVTLRLNDTASRIPAGHRLRVAISSTYWPMVWPVPGEGGFALLAGEGRLELPLLERGRLAAGPVTFAEPVAAAPAERVTLAPAFLQRRLERDLIAGADRLEVVVDDGIQRIEAIDLTIGSRCEEVYTIRPDDPASACIEARWTHSLVRGEWRVETRLSSTMRRVEGRFAVRSRIVALEGESVVFDRSWERG